MARLFADEIETKVLGGAPDGGVFFRLGLMYATGRDVSPDRVAAHKWFNLAVAKGCRDAIPHRRELAAEMTAEEIAEALRQARAFVTMH